MLTSTQIEQLSSHRIATSLKTHRPRRLSRILAPQRAAVAVILRYRQADRPDVLLMKRVDNPDDRWSGHMSFPGGRHEPEDERLLNTAIRETREEVGLELDNCAKLIGRLNDIRAIARGRTLPMAISPFVFELTREDPVVLGSEAQSTLWLPLSEVVSGRLDASTSYKFGPITMELPCWRYEGRIIWGLTHRMLKGFLKILGQ